MLSTAVGRLRAIGMVEAVSFLLLLGIAMPLKYVWEMPIYVKYVGWAHGVLFILFAIALLQAWTGDEGVTFKRAAIVFVCALLPFGPFIVDNWLKDWSAEKPV